MANPIAKTQITVSSQSMVDAVNQLKKRMGPDEYISELNLVSHGQLGGGLLLYRRDKHRIFRLFNIPIAGVRADVLSTADLDSFLAVLNRPGATIQEGSMNEALYWLRGRMGKESVVCLLACQQASSDEFPQKLSLSLNKYVQATTGVVKGISDGSWWEYHFDVEKVKIPRLSISR